MIRPIEGVMYLNPNAKCSSATELPGNIFAAHHTHDFTADLILEDRPPWDQAETEPVVDHGKSAAGQLRRAQKLSTHRLALLNRREGKTPLGGELAAGPLHLLVLKSQDEIGSRPPRAIDRSQGMALPDQLVGAPIESLTDLGAESTHSERTLVSANEPPIEPSGAIAFHLLVKVAAGENAYACRTDLASIVGPGANLEIPWDEPTIGAGPLDNARAAQRLQTPHVGVNKSLIVASADAGRRGLQHLAVSARAIDASAGCDDCNVAIGGTLGRSAAHLDDRADFCLLDCRGVTERDVMHAPVNAIDDESDAVAEFVGQPFVDHAAGDRRLRLLTARDERSRCSLLPTVGECPIDRLDNVVAFTQVAHDRLQAIRERPIGRAPIASP